MEIKEKRPATKVIKLARNFGAVAATKTGMKHVSGDCVAVVAADLQDPIGMVLEMADCWLDGHKFVICTRTARADPFLNRLFAAAYYRLVRALIVDDYPIGGFDLMLFDKTMLPFLVNSNKNINTHLYAFWLGFKPKVLTYKRPERRHGKSMWTFGKRLKLFLDTITGFSVTPIRLISGFGVLTSIGSFIYGLWILVGALSGHIDVAGFATLVSLICFFSGLILVMLGIVGEYLWRIFDIVSSKPESVIDEIHC